MNRDAGPQFEDESLRESFEVAIRLSDEPRLLEAWAQMMQEPRLLEKASQDPRSFFVEQGIDLPEKLDIIIINGIIPEKPGPDFEYFTIRLVNCRSYWLKKLDGVGYEQVEICRGIEIVPRYFPGGPIA